MASSYSSYHSGGRSHTDFTKLSDQIGSSIQKITQNVTSLKRIVTQLESADDSEKVRAEFHKIQHYTNELAKDTRDKLKDLSTFPMPEDVNEQRKRRMQKERLTNEFSKVLQTFQNMQRDVAKNTSESIHQQKRHSNTRFFSDDRSNPLIQLDSPVQNEATMQMQLEDQVQLDVLREQEKAMHQLETDIVSVNEIFRDLATMVHEQGEVVDSIEAQIESTSIHVSDANQQLSKASEYKSSLRKKKLCLFMIVVIILLIIIGIVIWQAQD